MLIHPRSQIIAITTEKIKSAVLRAYELLPKAYQQYFRSWERRNGQTYVAFDRDLNTYPKHRLTALNITTCDALCD